MRETVEGSGTVVTGEGVAPVVEPMAGESVDRAMVCRNCATPLVGEYCHHCGQSAHVHRSLSALGHDALHSLFHFEGKIWRTLPMLAWRPGELTRRYIQGERARFVSPIALFLFSVLLLFAVINAIGGPSSSPRLNFEGVTKEIANERQKAGADLTHLERQRNALIAARKSTAVVDASIEEARNEIRRLDRISGNEAAPGNRLATSPPATADASWLEEGIRKANENPSLLIYKIQMNAYKFSWALIPISVPFVWLLLASRRQFGLYDHAIFVTYSIAFMTLLVVLLSIGRAIGLPQTVIALSFGLVPQVHMYRQLKGAYGLSRFGALWRTFFLAWFAVIAALLFVLLMIAIGIA